VTQANDSLLGPVEFHGRNSTPDEASSSKSCIIAFAATLAYPSAKYSIYHRETKDLFPSVSFHQTAYLKSTLLIPEMDIRPEPLSSDEEGWSDPELPRSDEEERSHLERRRRYEEGRSDPEPLSSDEETSEPVALIGDSRFHPDPSLCSECQNILVSVTSFPDPISSLKDIHKRRHRCMCCEVIFNINRRGIRWKTFSATRYPFTPLDAGSIDESMDSVFIYSFDRSLALKCLDKQASHVSKVEVLMIESRSVSQSM
jgi:hypothetical protein